MDLPAEATFRLIAESTFSPFCLVDHQGYITWIGPTIEELLGAPAERFVGKHLLEHLAPEFHEVALSAYEDYINEVVPVHTWDGPPMDVELLHIDGSRVPCEVSAAIGSPYGFDGLVLQMRRSQGTLRLYDAVDALAVGAPIEEVLTRLAALCEHDMPGSSVTIGWDWDGDRFVHAVSEPEDLGASVTEVEPKHTPWHDAMDSGEVAGGGDLAEDHPELAEAVADAGFATCWVIPITIRGEGRPTAAVVLWRRDGGEATPHHRTVPQRISRLVAFAIESGRHRAQLERAATTDELTGLHNRLAQRRVLTSLLDDEFKRTAVLYCDLDDFKPVNDAHGHELGDRVLAIVARRLAEAVRDGDRVARWGGDEFVVVCDSADDGEALALGERLIEVVQSPIGLDGLDVRVGLSVGVARAHDGDSVDDLLRRADDALHDAKAAGKNRAVLAR